MNRDRLATNTAHKTINARIATIPANFRVDGGIGIMANIAQFSCRIPVFRSVSAPNCRFAAPLAMTLVERSASKCRYCHALWRIACELKRSGCQEDEPRRNAHHATSLADEILHCERVLGNAQAKSAVSADNVCFRPKADIRCKRIYRQITSLLISRTTLKSESRHAARERDGKFSNGRVRFI